MAIDKIIGKVQTLEEFWKTLPERPWWEAAGYIDPRIINSLKTRIMRK